MPKRAAPTSRGSSAYTRKRAVIACQVCRARRTKCDQKKPSCSFCESIGAECVSDPPALSAFDPASLAIIERLDRLEHEFKRFAGVSTSVTPGTLQPCLPSLLYPDEVATRPDAVLPQILDQILNWPVLQDQRLAGSPSSQGASPIADDPHGSAGRLPQAGGERILVNGLHVRLAERFFAHVHNRNPILDEANTRRLVCEVYEAGISWDTRSCLVLLVWANGALARPFPATPAETHEDVDDGQATALFEAAQQRFGAVFVRAGVVEAQCFFLAGVFLMSSLRPLDAWRMFLQALSICRTAMRTTQCSRAHSLELESVYWSSWKSERELNRELRMTLEHAAASTLALPEYFASFPENCGDEQLHTWYFYLSEISAWRLETHIAEEMLRSASGAQVGLQGLTEIADSLMGQVVELQSSLAMKVFRQQPGGSGSSGTGDGNDMLQLIMRARITYLQDLISWPFVRALIQDGIEPQSQAVRDWTVKGLSCHVQRLLNHRPQFYHRHHGTWLMIRNCARSAGLLLGAARLPFGDGLLPLEWRAVVEDALGMLQFWQPHLPDLRCAIERIHGLYYLVAG
ncbi:hypothetical protein BDV19DRAFT_395322 [Aspergillus venezuelensis]